MNLNSFVNTARLVLGACIAAAAVSAAAGPRDDEVAAVSVSKQVLPQQVVYTYTVTNKGDRPITALSVGFDFYRGAFDLSGKVPARLGSPAGWSARSITVEESDAYELRWENPQAPIQPGQTVGGFSVTVPAEDARFAQSHWTVLVDGPPVHASSTVTYKATDEAGNTGTGSATVTPPHERSK
ncbi:MAG: hypothetical protein ACJ8LG_12950 [Massilia sp.]